MNKSIINNVSKVLLIVFLLQFTVPVNAEIVELKNGTPLELLLYHTINSKTARIGKPVIFKLFYEVKVNGKIILPAGAKATGEIIHAEGPRIFGKPGTLLIKANSIQAIDGSNVALSASEFVEGKNRVVTAIILTTLFLFGFLIKGGNASLQKGAIISATTNGDVDIEL